MKKNVVVTDEKGKIIGATYLKRARGLVKNGRALYVDDCTIRLSAKAEPSDDKSEGKHMNYISLNLKDWSVCDTMSQRKGPQRYFEGGAECSFISDFDGELVESFTVGDWYSYVEIMSVPYALIRDTEYRLVFWLNGGENDRGDEICQLRIMFSGTSGRCNTYKLNRSFIKPLLHYQGWELYSIPFRTPGAGAELASTVDTRFSFAAGKAPMTVKPAKELEAYADWEDMPDEFAGQRPQRHNIVFEDGWPSINMYGGDKYSTEALRNRKAADKESGKESGKERPSWETDYMSEECGDDWEDELNAMEDEGERIQERVQDILENEVERIQEKVQDILEAFRERMMEREMEKEMEREDAQQEAEADN